MPYGSKYPVHTTEVLIQVKNLNAPEGGWYGGDSCFEKIHTCVILMKKFGVDATFMIKNSTFYPQ